MTLSLDAAAGPHLPTLVERLTAFLRGRPYQERAALAAGVPDDLAHVLDGFGHHIVVLTLVARADDNILDNERHVIFRYCVDRAARIGHPLTEAEKHVLKDYLSNFYPPLASRDEALERLKHDSKADLGALLEAAHDVIGADHVFRVDEVSFLVSLRRDLSAL